MPGSFVVNVKDAIAREHPVAGIRIGFEPPGEWFPDTGITIQVLQPGQPNCKYHAEDVHEDFLVLGGECLVLLDGEERTLEPWDFVHCAAGTPHVFVGAGDGPCWILAIGVRREPETLDFPADERAARYGASSPVSTDDGDEAYADWEGGPPPGLAPQVTPPWPPADRPAQRRAPQRTAGV
jgi:uncharacterized cupin superfamily protein